MDDWFTQLTQTVERSLEEAAKQIEDQVGLWLDQTLTLTDEWIEQTSEQFQAFWPEELEQQLEAFADAIAAQIFQFEADAETAFRPVNQTVEPWLNEHPVCIGCRNYHGQSYGGETLICAMHPYGCEGEKCPDWESAWGKPEP